MPNAGLTLRDKIALIYSLAGSQRRAADFIGISHQKVGRVLRPFELGGYKPDSKALADPLLNAQIDSAFSIYKDFARRVATQHGLPFIDRAPIYMERLPLTVTGSDGRRYIRIDAKGEPILGDRVAALRTHWISDEMRRVWIAEIHATGFFNNVSIRSTVDLLKYFDAGEERLEGKRGGADDRRWKYRAQLLRKIELGQTIGHIFTPYQALDDKISPKYIVNAIESVLRARHEHCALALSDEYLLQIDSRKHGSKAKFKPAKARGATRRNRGSNRSKQKPPASRAGTSRKKAPSKAGKNRRV